jgi:glutamate formiminotransferase / 5-formyltetrahydrofolate cyclo-ligase
LAPPVTSSAVLECVVNVSEGRRPEVLDRLAAAAGRELLDVHADPDHHRSVFTLAGERAGVEAAALRLAETACRHIDLTEHRGAHPRLGAVDVVPFVALDGEERQAATSAARAFAGEVAERLGIPVFLYDQADPSARSLPDVRRDAFRVRPPDFGPPEPHPRWGATAVGARPPLVAVNCELDTGDLAVASEVARRVRERDGGLPGVRALGFLLGSRGQAQVSMNLVDLQATGVEAACSEVRRLALDRGTGVTAVELVGLLPAAELARCSVEFLDWSGLGRKDTIESRLRAAGPRLRRRGDTESTPSRWEPETRLGAG